jgi:surfeit locus 1 family protein
MEDREWRMKPRSWPVIVAAAIGILILCGLGAWQLQRLAWKQAILAEIAAKADAAPVSLDEALKRQEAGQDVEYLKVEAKGRWIAPAVIQMLTTFDGGPGREIIGSFESDGGLFVLADRGAVPDGQQKALPAPTAAAVEGVIRRHENTQSLFDPDNDPPDTWYWWDVPAMLAAANAPADARVAPFIVQIVASTDALPRPQPPTQAVHNNHLQYAITWFALALVLGVMTVLFLRSRNKPVPPPKAPR